MLKMFKNAHFFRNKAIEARKEEINSLLELIDKAAGEGKISIKVQSLSEGAQAWLKGNGFLVVDNPGDWAIHWKDKYLLTD